MRILLPLLLLSVAAPLPAFAQAEFEPAPGSRVNTGSGALPWEQGGATPAAEPLVTPPQPKAESLPWEREAAAPAPMDAPEDRDADDRKLNRIAGEYYDVSVKDAKAVKTLDALAKRVKNHMALLKTRSYDTSDLMKDAKSLQTRIAVTRKKAAAQQVADKAVEAVSTGAASTSGAK